MVEGSVNATEDDMSVLIWFGKLMQFARRCRGNTEAESSEEDFDLISTTIS